MRLQLKTPAMNKKYKMKQSDRGHNAPATSVVLASLLLPGLAALSAFAPLSAVAESAPEKTTIAIKYGCSESR